MSTCYIEKTIEPIFFQLHSNKMEILVTSGPSKVGKREIIQELEKHNPKLYLIDNPGQIDSTFNTNYGLLHLSSNI